MESDQRLSQRQWGPRERAGLKQRLGNTCNRSLSMQRHSQQTFLPEPCHRSCFARLEPLGDGLYAMHSVECELNGE